MNLYADSLHGTVIRSSVVAGFTLTETAYNPGLALPKHSHHCAYFCFVLQGRFTEFYGQHARACAPSTLIYHPSGEAHSDHFHTGARCFNLQMNIRWAERARHHSMLSDVVTSFHDGFLTQLATRLYQEFRQMDEFSPLIIEGLTLEMMAGVARHSVKQTGRTPPRWLERARELLRDQAQEHPTLSQVAESVGVHATHLSREFRRYYRCTVGEYIRRLRIEFACGELSASDSPLSEIALAAGFVDQSHFSRAFKKTTGLSPSAYRKAFRAR